MRGSREGDISKVDKPVFSTVSSKFSDDSTVSVLSELTEDMLLPIDVYCVALNAIFAPTSGGDTLSLQMVGTCGNVAPKLKSTEKKHYVTTSICSLYPTFTRTPIHIVVIILVCTPEYEPICV